MPMPTSIFEAMKGIQADRVLSLANRIGQVLRGEDGREAILALVTIAARAAQKIGVQSPDDFAAICRGAFMGAKELR